MKTKIAGVPVTVVSAEEAEKCEYVICAPADGRPRVPGSITVQCCKCGVSCWLAPSTPVKPAKICYNCMTRDA